MSQIPSISLEGGVGYNASLLSLQGTDNGGVLFIQVGSDLDEKQPLFSITFTSAFTSPPRVCLTSILHNGTLANVCFQDAVIQVSETGFSVFAQTLLCMDPDVPPVFGFQYIVF